MRHFIAATLITPFLVGTATAAATAANWGEFERDFEGEARTWNEIQARLPAYPEDRNLVRVEIGGTTSHRYFVDRASLSAGEDDVVRYVMVIRSATGAENVSFEGMRCETGERKLYAFGRKQATDGEWSRNRNARWEPIQARLSGGYHRELFFHYFCTVEAPNHLPTIRRLLDSGGQYQRDY